MTVYTLRCRPGAHALLRADEDLMRKVTPLLQKHLQLSTTGNW
jgi:hypothetical protein